MSPDNGGVRRALVVTSKQFQAGYRVLRSGSVLTGDADGNTWPLGEARAYTKIRDLDDGNVVVVDPYVECLDHYAQTSAEMVTEALQGGTTPIPWADPKDFAAASRATLQELRAVQALAREAADPDQSLPQRRTGVFALDTTESKLSLEHHWYPGGFVAYHAREVERELWPAVMKALGDGRRYVVRVETGERDDIMVTSNLDYRVDQIKDPLPRIPIGGDAVVVRTTRVTVLLLDPHDAQIGEWVQYIGDLENGRPQFAYRDLGRTRWERAAQGAWVRLADPTPGPGEDADSIYWTGQANASEGVIPLYVPPIGSVWEWEPLKPHARQRVTVTNVRLNDEWQVESENERGERYWNDLSRWVEATVLVRPHEPGGNERLGLPAADGSGDILPVVELNERPK